MIMNAKSSITATAFRCEGPRRILAKAAQEQTSAAPSRLQLAAANVK